MGMRVIAIDGGDAKRDLCLSLGAEQYIDYTSSSDIAAEVMKITSYGAQGVIVFSATKSGYEQAPHLLRPGGTMVCVGLPTDPTVMAGASPFVVVMKKLNIVGSVVGTLKEAEEALDCAVVGQEGALGEVQEEGDVVDEVVPEVTTKSEQKKT